MPDGDGDNAGEPDDNASASPPTAPPDKLRLRYGIVAVVWLPGNPSPADDGEADVS